MGRRGINIAEQDKWVFNRLAADYRSRPPYPDELVDALVRLAPAGGSVADLGAGIGHLAIPLARRGLRATAVEPAGAMLDRLRQRAGEEEVAVEAVQATAERSTLEAGAWDLVLLADVLQWVDPELAGREAARLLRPSGVVAVIESRMGQTPFQRGLQEIFRRLNPRAKAAPPVLRQFLALAAGGAGPRTERFRQEAELDEASLASIIRSLSYIGPALAPAQLEQVLGEARRLAKRYGAARWQRELILTWAPKKKAP
jgi:ubiquinone/menaquinone biosynthesis C-methylase UbiE